MQLLSWKDKPVFTAGQPVKAYSPAGGDLQSKSPDPVSPALGFRVESIWGGRLRQELGLLGLRTAVFLVLGVWERTS